MTLRDKIEKMLIDAMEKSSLKKTPLLQEGRIDIPNFNSSLRGARPFSDKTLKEIADSGFFPISYRQLRLLRALDEYPELREMLVKPLKSDPDYPALVEAIKKGDP